jgi:hypothetical protein
MDTKTTPANPGTVVSVRGMGDGGRRHGGQHLTIPIGDGLT